MFNESISKYAETPPFVQVGYEPQTTFWGDFGVADVFYKIEPNGIRDTYNRSFRAFKDDKIYATELAMVLNWKAWEWGAKNNRELCKLYSELFEELDAYILDHWKGEDLDYYLRTTD